jgi:hypothetical protein
MIYEPLPVCDTVVSHFLSNCWHLQVASYYRIWHIPLHLRMRVKDIAYVPTLSSGNLTVLSQGNLLVHGRSLQGPRSTTPAVTRTQHTLSSCVFFIWQMFSLSFPETIQIYNTLESVSTALAQTQLLVTF